mgnify:CR=1 FL=1
MTVLLNFRFSPNGATSGGKVYTYKSGSYITKATYPTLDDATNETNALSNPVILDSQGEATIFTRGPTKVVLKDANDNIVWVTDDFDSEEDRIVDANGNELIDFYGEPNSVNNLNISNATTGNSPILASQGSDTNVGVGVAAKSAGKVVIPTGNTTITLGDITLSSGNLDLTVGDVNITSGDLNLGTGSVIINDATSSFTALPVGLVTWSGAGAVPSGWLECDGSAISRTTYASLFSAIGTTYGVGDGSTTFNLPDQARRALVGKGGSGTGTLGNSIGDTGGTETHTLLEAEMPAHTHSYSIQDDRREPWIDSSDHDLSWNATTSNNFDSTGGDTAHNIVQPSLVMMMIIRTY